MGVTAEVIDTEARTDPSTSAFALAAAVLGFFAITLDAVVVNVALPSIRSGLGGGITGLPSTTPNWALAAAMVLAGLGGPLTMPPMTAVLLNHVPPHATGVASAVFNTSRQLGGAMAVAVFGALLASLRLPQH